MIDKITSLYGFVIKSNNDQNLEVIRKKLLAIIHHLAALMQTAPKCVNFIQLAKSLGVSIRRQFI